MKFGNVLILLEMVLPHFKVYDTLQEFRGQ
jgi:hypothetical protein